MKTRLGSMGMAAALALAPLAARAQDESAQASIAAKVEKELPSPLEGEMDHAEEFETKHVFGVTEGSDVGEAGDREAEFTTNAHIGKQGGGRFGAVEQQATYEVAPTNRFGYELNLHGVALTTAGVPGIAPTSQMNFSGLSALAKYIVVKRDVDGPIGIAVQIEPEWDRIDPVIGLNSSNFVLPVTVLMDSELIKEKLYAGANIIYSPEWDRENGAGFSQYALFGLTGAMVYRVTPKMTLGAQVEYYNVYYSLGFSNWAGWGTYVGPVLHYQISHGAFLSASWSSKIAGSPANGSAAALGAYNASDLAEQRAKLVFGIAF